MEDNKARIMLSDILWNGVYSIRGDLILVTLEPNFEIPSGEILFEIFNPNRLLKTDDSTQWEKI